MLSRLPLFALALLLGACAATPSFTYSPLPTQPELASGYQDKPGWATRHDAVAAANPLATDAGRQVLAAGGSALDAAIAVQMVLGLVEPQSSGIGGGALLLYWDGKAVSAWDGRETAPAAADERLFLTADGKPMDFDAAVVGGRSVGVPGAVAMLEMAHREQGRLPWAALFQPAINLAEQGFAVSPRLYTLLQADDYLRRDPVAAVYFYQPDGKPWPVGHVLKNPPYAEVLRAIAAQGSKALLQGPVAAAIVAKVRGHAANPGLLTLADLAAYRPKKRTALCSDYRAREHDYRLCGFPPPSSGMLAIGQILGILNNTAAAGLPLQQGADGKPLPSPQWLHLYTEASRLAFADRGKYVGDPDFVAAPGGNWLSMLAPGYLAARAGLIGETSMKTAQPGQPGMLQAALGMAAPQPEYGTSHISIIDADGHALSMTTTVEAQFGSRQMVNPSGHGVGGFLLNNQLTDFNFAPNDAAGLPTANRVQPGKRPRSSMSPTLVFDKAGGQVLISAGSPGGAQIIHYTAKTLYAMLNWGMDAQQAISLPNFGASGAPTQLEQGRFPPATVAWLQAHGHEVRETEMTSGLQAIGRRDGGFFGGADPRREGVVMGE
ncbi:gamma-glutamyltransferase family protein [Vogesella sp. LIG4]|uniref:gamma-glutamyltransferase family protein n=1 Tax=Vogesella sp. LIG4 TaxID=1192162 RepID=UPI00081FC43B|nr:gamma-glutamyltransferase family protein [Vogesella sp. LIG4]SCK22280.1 gamma-glutamyltranspeptidase / glutathione hydrolase [Vogesella sp. LIG4]